MNHPEDAGPDAAPAAHDGAPSLASLAQEIAAKSGVERRDNGHVDLLKAAGGVRGMAESVVPGLVFLIPFTVLHTLLVPLLASVAAAVLFTLARLLQKTPLTQALAGLVGVGISAALSLLTGKAENYYLWGFITNAGYIAAMAVSVLVKWPVIGLLFGYVRNEGLHWRRDSGRLRAYGVATWIMVGVMALRLLVQFPLYLAGQVAALGTTRLLMGLPLYALGLWLAWLVSRPAPVTGLQTAGPQPAARSTAKAGPSSGTTEP